MDLKDTDHPFALLAEYLPQLVWTVCPDGRHDYFNRRWYDFTGLTPEQSLNGEWRQAVHPDDKARVLANWEQALDTGEPYECEFRIRNAEGVYQWVLSRAMPERDASGAIVRWFGTSTDIDRQKRAEEALRRLERQHRLALEAARLGTWRFDVETGDVYCDEGACAILRIPRQGPCSVPVAETMESIHPDDHETIYKAMADATAPESDGRYEVEYRTLHPGGYMRWIRSVGQAFFVQEGSTRRAESLFGVISDITERRVSDEAQQLLTRELNHRVKNLFAIANGMVSMTARTAKDQKEMASALRGRLGALSRAHELAQPMQSLNAGCAAPSLSQLIEAVIEPYKLTSPNRIRVGGPGVRIGTTTTTSLALVLHELATNAAKYGSLSRPEGELSIEWHVESDKLDLCWVERGGPVIENAPIFEGFGTQLSQRSIAGQLGGALERHWHREGLLVHMLLPLERLAS